MIGLPVAHVGGIPIEETLAMYGPGVLVALGVAAACVRARLRRGVLSRHRPHPGRRFGRVARSARVESNSDGDDRRARRSMAPSDGDAAVFDGERSW
jgi:hypothetical protein